MVKIKKGAKSNVSAKVKTKTWCQQWTENGNDRDRTNDIATWTHEHNTVGVNVEPTSEGTCNRLSLGGTNPLESPRNPFETYGKGGAWFSYCRP